MFRNVIGDKHESPTFVPFDTVESVRHNADQDVRELVDAHSQFEQFFAMKRLVYASQNPDKMLESVSYCPGTVRIRVWNDLFLQRLAEMRKAVKRKETLITRHHQNLQRWATVMKSGTSAASSGVEKTDTAFPAPQPGGGTNEAPGRRLEPQRPVIAAVSTASPVTPGTSSISQAVFAQQQVPVPVSYQYNTPGVQGYSAMPAQPVATGIHFHRQQTTSVG